MKEVIVKATEKGIEIGSNKTKIGLKEYIPPWGDGGSIACSNKTKIGLKEIRRESCEGPRGGRSNKTKIGLKEVESLRGSEAQLGARIRLR